MSIRDLVTNIGRGLRQPVRTTLFTPMGRNRIRYVLRPPRSGPMDQSGALAVRRYRDYDDYVRHQRSKLALLDLTAYECTLRAGLAARFAGRDLAGRSVLCLAARLGAEVRAFHDLGAFAVGVDLNPGAANRYVLPGDFHALAFPDRSVDVVYSNSLDHALDLRRVLAEIARVLKPGGTLLLDAQEGTGTQRFDEWSATSWHTIDDLADVVTDTGLTPTERSPITTPWPGELLRFERPTDS